MLCVEDVEISPERREAAKHVRNATGALNQSHLAPRAALRS